MLSEYARAFELAIEYCRGILILKLQNAGRQVSKTQITKAPSFLINSIFFLIENVKKTSFVTLFGSAMIFKV